MAQSPQTSVFDEELDNSAESPAYNAMQQNMNMNTNMNENHIMHDEDNINDDYSANQSVSTPLNSYGYGTPQFSMNENENDGNFTPASNNNSYLNQNEDDSKMITIEEPSFNHSSEYMQYDNNNNNNNDNNNNNHNNDNNHNNHEFDDDDQDNDIDIDMNDNDYNENMDEDENDNEFDDETHNEQLNQNENENDDENQNQNQDKNKKITTPYLTKYEKARVLGTRALQISLGAPVMVEMCGETDPLEIASKELRERKIPMIIRRFLPNGDFEDWKVKDLKIR